MDENNLSFENLNSTKKKWYGTEGFKTGLTILAILLIPATAFGWNYLTGRNSDDNILESEAKDNGDQSENGDIDSNGNGNNTDRNTLPNTSAGIKYTVKNTDTVRSISSDICGNNTFYLKNIDLRIQPGDEIEVRCK